MENWQGLTAELKQHYAVVRSIKRTAEKELVLLQDRETEQRVMLRNYPGEIMPVYQLLAGKQLEHLPRILEVKPRDNGFYVLEEFVEGVDLSHETLTNAEVLCVLRQLCTALSQLHGLGIVHRDVKPDNLILTPEGSLYLLDFDAARLYKHYIDHDTCMLGTTGFAAPEQFGIAQTDYRADIFALGVTLNILKVHAHPSDQLCAGWARYVVLKCTQIDPKARYRSAKKVWSSARFLSFLFPESGSKKKAAALAVFATGILICTGLLGERLLPAYTHTSFDEQPPIESSSDPEASQLPILPEVEEHQLPDSHPDKGSSDKIALPENSFAPAPESPLLSDKRPKPWAPAIPVPQPVLPTPEPMVPELPKPLPEPESMIPETQEPLPKPDRPEPPAPNPEPEPQPKPEPEPEPDPTPNPGPPPKPAPNPGPTDPPAPPSDPNDITQKEGYAEVKAAHDAYCAQAQENVPILKSYEECFSMPYYTKYQAYQAEVGDAQRIWNDCHLETVLAREHLESLQAADPPDEAAIAEAQSAYDMASAAEDVASVDLNRAQADLNRYAESSEYLLGKQEEDRRYRAYQEANDKAGVLLVRLNDLEAKYGIHIFIPNPS